MKNIGKVSMVPKTCIRAKYGLRFFRSLSGWAFCNEYASSMYTIAKNLPSMTLWNSLRRSEKALAAFTKRNLRASRIFNGEDSASVSLRSAGVNSSIWPTHQYGQQNRSRTTTTATYNFGGFNHSII